MNLGPTYCINLSERTERWEQVSAEFKRIGIEKVERFNAIRMSPGFQGCRESHLAILEQCRGFSRFTIFEDDVQFVGDLWEVLRKVDKQLPAAWDMLYLGAHLMAPVQKYSENLYHLTNAYCTHAIIFNNPELPDFILSHREGMRKIDVFYQSVIQEQFNCFISYPMIATQSDSYSDIINRQTRYSRQMIDNFNSKLR